MISENTYERNLRKVAHFERNIRRLKRKRNYIKKMINAFFKHGCKVLEPVPHRYLMQSVLDEYSPVMKDLKDEIVFNKFRLDDIRKRIILERSFEQGIL